MGNVPVRPRGVRTRASEGVSQRDVDNFHRGHGPAPFVAPTRPHQHFAPYTRGPAALGLRWVADRPDDFWACPRPLDGTGTYYRKPSADITHCLEEPHLEFLQVAPAGFAYTLPESVPRPPELPQIIYDSIPDHQQTLLFGSMGRNSVWPHLPRSWQAPSFPHSPGDSLAYVPDSHLTLALWHIMQDADINPLYLRHFFPFLPDPVGTPGGLTYLHPIMRRLAALAYCVHFPSPHGVCYDVARECGRARAQQADETYHEGGTGHGKKARLRAFASEMWAFAPNAAPATRLGLLAPMFYGARVAARLHIAHRYASKILDPSLDLDIFSVDHRPAYVENRFGNVTFQPLTCPWEARTSYLGWADSCGFTLDSTCLPFKMSEQTRWTTRACDRLLLWSLERPGPQLVPADPRTGGPSRKRPPS